MMHGSNMRLHIYACSALIRGTEVVENVTAEYFAGNRDGKIGCQLIFSDIGTPKSTWTPDSRGSPHDAWQ